MFERFSGVQNGSFEPKLAYAHGERFDGLTDDTENTVATYLKVAIHQRLLDKINLSALEKMSREDIAIQISPLVRKLLNEERAALNSTEYAKLLEELLDEVLGLGPLEPLLKDPQISDILVNTCSQVFVERLGVLERTQVRFKDDSHLLRIIQKIVSAVGRRVDESQPWVDARLADGSRVNALLPPCAVDGPLLSIRKFAKIPFTIDRLIENETITSSIAEIFEVLVGLRLNVLISGGTGTGKTTLLNALSSLISNNERIVTIEDTAELQLQQDHVGRMETRPPNLEGAGEVSQRDLVKNALRMRPDRIILGEVRGAEVIDMLQAMNTGHDGSMTTIHANTARDALTRLEHMTAMTGFDIPTKSLRGQMASAIEIVVQLKRFSDGTRRVVSIQEITGLEGDVISMQEIVKFVQRGVSVDGRVIGEHVPTGIRPRFSERAKELSFNLPEALFKPGAPEQTG
ncbi:MAG: type II secretion system protein E [Hyphococcus sp.]|nr:MAG: type II secretion system protein E [Marinicaulis sp.]